MSVDVVTEKPYNMHRKGAAGRRSAPIIVGRKPA
nr:MAG TPA: hypothetical protein [Caudoviricetes sp.]